MLLGMNGKSGKCWAAAVLAVAAGGIVGGDRLWAAAPAKPAAAGAATAGTRPTTGPAAAAELRATYDRFAQEVRQIPQDRFDPAAVLELAGRDPTALVKWVAENTDPLPYRGALRGPVGVLLDRAGSSLDRSLLLAELLRTAGYEVRLANATLPEVQAKPLAVAADRARAHAADVNDADPAVADARRRAATQADRLLAALGPPAAAAPAAGPDAVAAVADHWWVQRKQGDGWVDADPSGLTGLTPARTVAAPAGAAAAAAAALDAKDCHEVELRVVIEAFRSGKLVTERVLGRTFRPVDGVGRRISLSHVAGEPMPDADFENTAPARQRLRARLVGQKTYLPVLRVDDRPNQEASFGVDGTVDRNPNVDKAGKIGGAVTSGFGGLMGGGDDAKPKGVLTAEWVEYEVRSPGRPAVTVRRPVFDLIGPAARAAGISAAPTPDESAKFARALQLMGQTQIAILPCDLTPMYVLHAEAKAELRDKALWIEAVEGAPRSDDAVRRGIERMVGRDVTPSLFGLLRRAAVARPGATFVDRPNVVQHRMLVEPAADGGTARRAGVDLAFTSTAALGGGAEAFAARVRQGVADTLAEHLALGETASPGENTVAVFEAAAGAPTVVKPTDAAAVPALAAGPDVTALLRADQAAGNVLVVAAAVPGGRRSWWRVDAATGQTVGVMDTGYHAALTEQEAQYEKQFANFSTRFNPPISKEQFLKMKPADIAKLSKDANIVTNLQGLQADWNGLRLLRAMRAGYTPG